MSSNNPFKKLGTTLKKKLRPNLKSATDPGHSHAASSSLSMARDTEAKEEDVKRSGTNVSDRATNDTTEIQDRADMSLAEYSDAAGYNEDTRTLVGSPILTRQDTEAPPAVIASVHKERKLNNKKEEETKLQRVQSLAYEGLKESLRAVERCSDVLPPLKSATRGILEIIERYDAVKSMPNQLTELASKLNLLVDVLNSATSNESMKDRLNGLVTTFEEKTRLIADKLERSLVSRIIESSDDALFISRELNSIAFAIDIVMVDVSLKTNQNVHLLQESVSELQVIALLNKLKYAEGAGFNHEDRQGCTNGTRIMLLADLLAWATAPAAEHVFWLNGMAGTGKTTVAETFCSLLSRRGLLGASFFCSRKKLDRRNVRLIIPALAKALARAYPEFQTELLEVLKADLDFTGLGLEDQYRTLILQPAEKAFADPSKTVVLVVDALDECEDAQAAEMFLKTVLLRKPQCGIRLLVTSRPEPKIIKGFRSGAHASLRLQDIEAHLVKADIAVFLSNKLKEVEDLYTEYGSTWPPAELQTIVDHAGSLFIYAATAVKYISDDHGDPVERLAKFASMRPPVNAVEAIDEVYAYILAEAFSHKLDAEELSRVKACLSMVVCALEPMSVTTYGLLLGITDAQVRRAFSSLHSVVQVPDVKQDSEVIMLYHASFADYLLSTTRSTSMPWLVNPNSAHSKMAKLCLDVLVSKLHFNIAQASSSYKSNLEQSSQVAHYWKYIAIYWGTHLASSSQSVDKLGAPFLDVLALFLQEKYLFWLEILSVLNRVQVATATLLTLSKFMSEGSFLQQVCTEFASFASIYLVPIQTSAPHIYLSALPWVSHKSHLKALYSHKFLHVPVIHDFTKIYEDKSLLLQLTGHHGKVTSVAFASNSNFIASGSTDKTIRLWNAHTGEELMKPLFGHTEMVTAVAISPDCQLIASGSKDMTIKVWSVITGKEILKPLKGFIGSVTAVIFSSDSKLILSSASNAVGLWDVQQGGTLIKTLQSFQHAISLQAVGSITCIALSADGIHLATGSTNTTVSIWNIKTGQLLGKPLKGHTDYIAAVAFSPNYNNLLIASEDNNLSIWDFKSEIYAEKGVPKMFLKGHTNRITCAVYSHDGKYIASSSKDTTIRLWSAETGKEICRPLQGHTKRTTSVAFSKDGTSVVSASWDNTIRVWNTQTVNSVEPVKGHTNYVETVIFSQNDQYIVSGSRDQSICIWDVQTSSLKMPPLTSHSNRVMTYHLHF